MNEQWMLHKNSWFCILYFVLIFRNNLLSIEVTCEHSIVFLFFRTYDINVLSIEVTYNSFQNTDCSVGFEKVY